MVCSNSPKFLKTRHPPKMAYRHGYNKLSTFFIKIMRSFQRDCRAKTASKAFFSIVITAMISWTSSFFSTRSILSTIWTLRQSQKICIRLPGSPNTSLVTSNTGSSHILWIFSKRSKKKNISSLLRPTINPNAPLATTTSRRSCLKMRNRKS